MLAIYLRYSDPTLLGQFLLGFLARVRIRQVGVEILIQHLCGLLVKVAPFTSDKQRKEIMTNLLGMYIAETTMYTCSDHYSPQENDQPSNIHPHIHVHIHSQVVTIYQHSDRPGIKEA